MGISKWIKLGCLGASLAVSGVAVAGEYVFHISALLGVATGTVDPDPLAWNEVNSTRYSTGPETLPITHNYVQLFSVLDPAPEELLLADATGAVDKVTYRITCRYVPDPGETIETDPPDADLTYILTLTQAQQIHGHTGLYNATVSGSSTIKVETGTVQNPVNLVTFPELSASVTGVGVPFPPTGSSRIVKKIRTIATSGAAFVHDNLLLSVDTNAHYVFISSGGGPGGPGGLSQSSFGGPVVGPMMWSYAKIALESTMAGIVLTGPNPAVFPELFPLPSTDGRNRYVYSNSGSGILGNGDWVATVIGFSASDLLPDTVFTSFSVGTDNGTPGTKTTGTGNTIRQKFTYSGLPLNNTDFGNKQVTMKYTYPGMGTFPPTTTEKAEVQVFFPKYPNNHAGTYLQNLHSSKTPNWFWYWEQTLAGQSYDYWYGGPNGKIGAALDATGNGDWRAIIYFDAAGASAVGPNPLREGIDLFAAVVRHEAHHVEDFEAWWPNGYVPSLDNDGPSNSGDMIPDSLEATLNANHGSTPPYPYNHDEEYDPDLVATYINNEFQYGTYAWNDAEDHTHHWNDFWENGQADKEDWAKPGKQWK